MEDLLSYAPLLVLMLLWPLLYIQRSRREDHRLAAIDRKLKLLMDQLGVVEPALPAVAHQLAAGKKIQAIKAYREATGAGLKEAKEAVERLAGQR